MPDFELIVVDDCSQPPITQFQVNGSADGRVRLERLCAPSGAAVAKNRGVSLSHAPIIAFLDDDDLYQPTYLEQSLAALERFPDLDVVFMGVGYFSDCPDPALPQHRELMSSVLAASGAREIEEDFYVFGDGLLRGLLLTGLPMAFQRPVARRRAFQQVGGYRNGFQYWDNDWTIRAVKAKLKVAILDKGLYRQRIGPQQLVTNGTKLEHCEHAMKVLGSILSGLPGDDPDRSLFRQSMSECLFGRAYINRDAGNWAGAISDFIACECQYFRAKRFRFLASLPIVAFRSIRSGTVRHAG
jgi:hypothetical protein